jgi:NADH:ubiquinone oxidoreductase subunit
MKRFLLEFFTWWNGTTLGTRLWTRWRGEFVGEDEFGNRYFRERKGPRRWVVYNGLAEASAIPPGWHGWIHHRVDTPPGPYERREWEKPHLPNLTGTGAAYRPKGSILGAPTRPKSDGEYDAWTP